MGQRLGQICVWVIAGAAVLLQYGCLTPLGAVYHVDMKPQLQADEGFRIDPVDDALVFSKEGLRVKVRYQSDGELQFEIPGPKNPYVFEEVDSRLGYRPKAFTVFQVEVVNPTFAKVRLDPEKAALITDQGKRLDSYAINRTDARGGVRNFEAYFLARGVQTGNAQKVYLERMGKVRETIYHRDSPVFKGKTYSGKIIFAAIPPETKQVELVLYDFILGFGIDNEPAERVTLRFPFSVDQGVRKSLTERR